MTTRPKVILDTNLLVLLIVGLTSPRLIASHGGLKAYAADDFALLVGIVSRAAAIVVTPNTLSETSNLLKRIGEPARTAIQTRFAAFIRKSEERYVESATASRRAEFVRLGLADAALLCLSGEGVLLTADLGLYVAASAAGHKALNFNHVRDGAASFDDVV